MSNTFNRYEKKYLVSKDNINEILNDLMPYVVKDSFADDDSFYTICNIYYDTVTDQEIKKSVSKPIFKEKLRLRCYGNSGLDDVVYLEIKKKFNGVVNKRRTHITIREANNLILNKVMPIKKEYHNTQILNEIFFYVRNKELVPKISISYDREAYFCKYDKSLRITFDRNITSRRNHLGLTRSIEDTQIIDKDNFILEIKTHTSYPIWLTDILSKHKLFSKRFSKYGAEFYTHLLNNRKDEESCLNPYLTSRAHL